MMKLKANPKDTASVKTAKADANVVPESSSKPMSPFQQQQIYPSKSLDMSMADGIDSIAPGLNESIISAGSETINSMEEKKVDHSFSHYDSKQLAAMRTAHFSVDAENYRASYDVSHHEERVYRQQKQPKPKTVQELKQQKQSTPMRQPQPSEQRTKIQMQAKETQQTPQFHEVQLQAPQWNDPWSSDPWNDTFWSTSSSKKSEETAPTPTREPMERSFETPTPTHAETSFDTLQFQPSVAPVSKSNTFDTAFGVTPSDTTWGGTSSAFASTTFASTAVTTTTGSKTTTARRRNHVKINVAVQERLSILFDETAKGPICRVVGSIFVQPPELAPSPSHYSFCVTIRDKKGNIEQWDESSKSKCENITASVPHNAVDPGDQVYMVSLREGEVLEAPIVRYTCVSRLRPMPMLLKTKVYKKGSSCRVGLRLRSNPQNQYILTDIAVLMIVPLDMDGSSLSMSRKDGVWDEMKRTLTWTVQELPPGELIDIQAQFKVIDGITGADTASKFPILARCNGETSFSRIDANSDFTEEGSVPVDLEVMRSTSVLYRKV